MAAASGVNPDCTAMGRTMAQMCIRDRCAKMLDPEFNKGIEVVVLPNLYGDIVTDIAAEHQGCLLYTSRCV